jgi:hypothetical protein
MIEILWFIIRAAELSLEPFEDLDSVGPLQRIERLQLGIHQELFLFSEKPGSVLHTNMVPVPVPDPQ